jgi:hypothetical protein
MARVVREHGQVAPLVALVVAAVGGLVLGLGRLGAAAVDRAQARTAADAAALAGAADGRDAAEEVAAANGGRVVWFRRLGVRTGVMVEVGRAQAEAWAERRLAHEALGGGDGG